MSENENENETKTEEIQNKTSAEQIDFLLSVLDQQKELFPEGSVMSSGVDLYADSLKRLKEVGLPDEPDAELNPEQKAAMKDFLKAASVYGGLEIGLYGKDNDSLKQELLKDVGKDEAVQSLNQLLGDIDDDAVSAQIDYKPVELLHKLAGGEISNADLCDNNIAAEEVNTPLHQMIKSTAEKAAGFPEKSPMGIGYRVLLDKLNAVQEAGMPDNPPAAGDEAKTELLNQAASALSMMTLMENANKNPQKAEKYNLTKDVPNGEKTKAMFDNTVKKDIVKNLLGDNPTEKFNSLLTSRRALTEFTNNTTRIIKKDPDKALLPDDAVKMGSLFVSSENPKLQTVPGAKPEDISKSLEALKKADPNGSFAKKFTEVQNKRLQDNYVDNNNKLSNRMSELNNKMEAYQKSAQPEDSVKYAIAQKTMNGMERLLKQGLPKSNKDMMSPELRDALLDVGTGIGLLNMLENNQKSMKSFANDNTKTNEAKFDTMKNSVAKMSSTEELMNDILNSPVDNSKIYNSIKDKNKIMQDNGIPKTAELRGAFFREEAGGDWQAIPGTTQEERNQSSLNIASEQLSKDLTSVQKTMDKNIKLGGLQVG